MTDNTTLDDARIGDLIAFRRDLHNHPELGFTEYRTQARIAERLEALGFAIRLGAEAMVRDAMIGVPPAAVLAAARGDAVAHGAQACYVDRMADGMTGLVAELRRGEGPVVAMRFDVDALPLAELTDASHLPNRLGFASHRAGAMHACGHDGHATIGIGLAELAARDLDGWQGTLRLLFQPAEEGGRGARPMVEAGVVDDADMFFALHLGCDLASGRIAASASEMMFSAKWDLHFEGVAAHAAGNPENGRNALLAAAQATIGLHALPRHGRFLTHVNVGRLEAGSARNVVPRSAVMEVELRGGEEEALQHMESRGRAVIEAAALAQGCKLTVREMGRTIGASSSPGAARLVRETARSLGGIDDIDAWPLGGGDDAAFFMRRVQERGGEAAYLILGSDLAAGHHATNFDFNESDIGVGVRLMHGLLRGAATLWQGLERRR